MVNICNKKNEFELVLKDSLKYICWAVVAKWAKKMVIYPTKPSVAEKWHRHAILTVGSDIVTSFCFLFSLENKLVFLVNVSYKTYCL